MSPYGFGMYAAMVHLKDNNHSLLDNASIVTEWGSFIFLIASGFIGFNAELTTWMNPVAHFFWFNTGR